MDPTPCQIFPSDDVADRIATLRRNCAVATRHGLEIGPLASPIVRKDEGPIFYLDYASTDALKSKSSTDPSVNVANVVEIDFCLEQGSLAQVAMPAAPYQYVVASHVFEHVPNPIRWLEQVCNLLAPDGVVSLAIPDRRYTYDFYRASTTVAQLLSYHKDELTRPSAFQLYDHYLNVAKVDTLLAWSQDFRSITPDRYNSDEVADLLCDQSAGGRYVDCHCTVWTAEHFLTIFSQIQRLRSLPLEVSELHLPARGSNEFIVQLRRSA